MKDFINYTDKETKNLRKIKKDEVKIGDYADIDGYSGFCCGSYNRITDVITRYNEMTGKPYKVICCRDNQYCFDDGNCIKGASAYYIQGYYRLER